MIPFKFHDGNNYWDMALLNDMFKDPRFTPDDGEGCVYVVAGEYAHVSVINKAVKDYKWVVLILTSDEQSKFKIERIEHPNIKIWVMYPKQRRHDDYTRIPLGYTPHTRPNLKLRDKDLNWFFAGQVTHIRREKLIDKLRNLDNGELLSSEGFTQGFEPEEYVEYLNRTKTAPAPSGPICADSFRVYEALEAGAVPIADNISLAGDVDYFNYLFESVPFPTYNHAHDIPGYIEDQVKEYPQKNNRVQAWWIRYKRDLKQQLINDVSELSGKAYNPAITVVIPVSPIKSHPSTEILDKCISSIRHHLNCEIIITFDGVRKEQEDRRVDYEEFIRRALFKCNTDWNATPVIFDKHTHQVGMFRSIIENVTSPTILYVEGDTGLVVDKEIDFKYMVEKILDGTSNFIRLHFEGVIPKEHEQLMLETDDRLIETTQWSQRPHLASTAYYKRMLHEHFSPHARSFIEDKLHSIVAEAYIIDGRLGWLQHRLHIYAPAKDIKYSVDFDGRAGDKKYDESQVF